MFAGEGVNRTSGGVCLGRGVGAEMSVNGTLAPWPTAAKEPPTYRFNKASASIL